LLELGEGKWLGKTQVSTILFHFPELLFIQVRRQYNALQDALDAARAALVEPAFRVVGAGTAEEARAALARQPVAAILVSLVLPDSDGRSLAASLTQHPATAAIPVFILSPKVTAAAREESRRLGVAGWIEKPLDAAVLVRAVSAAVTRAAGRRSVDHLTGIASRAASSEPA